MSDSLVLQDKVYDDVAHSFEVSYIESLQNDGTKDLMLDVFNLRFTDCWFLGAAEVDKMIEFLTLARSKMEGDK